ncbi:DUF3883 domain-containing protein [Burkholderia metallica]|uniref:DUF3883 domain-containing protein n=1 Tax=Burkholderia metallica TaxID=488729 RepID=UPI001CF174FD|nr:DUF3883 domain-containing protein [Burkholderia metallica]MCA8021972.1 DUF3883 domain-containing protein [Burkholderia metallica]
MTSPSFNQLLSMPAFEGLRVLRIYLENKPCDTIEALVELINHIEPNALSYDLDAAIYLHNVVPKNAPHNGVMFYRACIGSLLSTTLPEWAKLITLGRGRFIKRLDSEEYRDIRSLFRQAKLLEDPPSLDDIGWWDSIQACVRTQNDAEKLRRARQAEQLSIEYERNRIADLSIFLEPRWMAIEDNTVGYDVLSYNPGEFGPLNKLIEVKSTIASPLRFFLTRNEWEQARKFGNSYVFHIWDMQKNPPMLYEKSILQIEPHVPHDNKKGKWKTALIPVGV